MINLDKFEKFTQKFSTNLKHPEDVLQWMIKVNGPHRLYIPDPQKIDFYMGVLTLVRLLSVLFNILL